MDKIDELIANYDDSIFKFVAEIMFPFFNKKKGSGV